MFPNRDIISPEADFVVYSADSPRRANFDPSVLYKGTLECKEMLLFHVDVEQVYLYSYSSLAI